MEFRHACWGEMPPPAVESEGFTYTGVCVVYDLDVVCVSVLLRMYEVFVLTEMCGA